MLRAATPLLLSLLLGACDPELDGHALPRWGDPELLVANAQWSATEAGDPFATHRPGEVVCERAAQSLEAEALELDTGACNYFLLEAPALTEIAEGDRVTVRAFHDDLAAPEPAQAHLALSIAGNVIWDEEVSIPSPAAPYTIDVDADFAAPAGVPIVLHLHNHGFNTYRMIDVRVAARY